MEEDMEATVAIVEDMEVGIEVMEEDTVEVTMENGLPNLVMVVMEAVTVEDMDLVMVEAMVKAIL